MVSNIVDDSLSGLMERGLDYSTYRQQVLANNIANINTPQFKRSDVSFSSVMKSMGNTSESSDIQTGMTNSRHIQLNENSGNRMAMFVSKTNNTAVRNDGNDVDVNKEMSDAAKNGMYQQALTQLLARRFRMIKDVIRGR